MPEGPMSEGLGVNDLFAGYKPGFPILHGVSIWAPPGSVVSLIGPNGAGKSTLIKAVAGLTRIEGGRIALNGKEITNIRPDRLADHSVAYVPQTENIFASLTIEQNLTLSSQRLRSDRTHAKTAMYGLFPALGEKRSKKAGTLSGGQRQMLAIAMALIVRPQLVLMDEPTAGLSPKAAQDVLSLIGDIARDGMTVVLVEQNAKAALKISDFGYVLAEGRVHHEGKGRDLLDDPVVGEIYLGARRRPADSGKAA